MPAFDLPLPAAYVVITATTAIIWTLLTWFIRLFIRLKIHGPFSWDDTHCTIATLSAIIQSWITIAQTRFGLGSHHDDIPQSVIERQLILSWTAGFFYYLALCCSMLSVCFLLVRITKSTDQVRIAYGIAILTACWGMSCVFVLAFQCALPTPWDTEPCSRCIDLWRAYLGKAITRAILELANIIAAIVLLWTVKMHWRTKAIVLCAFAIRLLVIPPSLVRLNYINQVLDSKDWGHGRVDFIILTQVSMHISVILATVPCARPWLVAFESGGLKAPAEVRRTSPHQPKAPGLAPILPIALPHARLDDPIAIETGRAEHRKRVEAWPVQMWASHKTDLSSNVTTVQYDPEEARQAARRRSQDSKSSRGIERTKSFSVSYEGIGDELKPQTSEPSRRRTITRAASYQPNLEDVGELLAEMTKEHHKQRTGSVGTV